VKGAGGLNDELPRAGDFGLFRLLAAGGIKPAGPSGVFVATWNLNRPGVPAVSIEFKSSKSVQPFARDFFSRLKCPQEISAPSAAPASVRSP
jgi:type VI protein secretion system component VasK